MIVRFLASRGSYELGISPFCGPGVATPCRTQKYQNRRESPWVDFLGPPPRPLPAPPPPRRQRLLLCQMASWGLKMHISGPPPTGHGLKATITWAEHAAHKDSDPQRCCIPFIPESASVSERATSLLYIIMKNLLNFKITMPIFSQISL